MYDLILKGGRVVDPAVGLGGIQDIAVHDGRIVCIEPSIVPEMGRKVIDLSGRIVTPGLIDLHTHVFDGVFAKGADPDLVGVYAGVTTLVDAGSAGCDTFAEVPKYIIPNSHTEILCFLHIGRTGLSTNPDIFSRHSIDLDGTIRVVEEHRDSILGIKVRMVSPGLEIFGMDMPRMARRAARETGTRLMVHIGDLEDRYDPNVARELLPIMEAGDIVTHLFTAYPGGVLDADGKLVPEAKEAVDRGVWLDTAQGRFNFNFDVGYRVIDQGLIPHCISTDITTPGRLLSVHSMTEMMTRLLAMGFTLEEVVTMSTSNPAKAIGEEERLGSLRIGRQADISVLEIREGDWVVYDAGNNRGVRTDKAFVPSLTLKRGRVFTPEWGPRPWGWEPDEAGGHPSQTRPSI